VVVQFAVIMMMIMAVVMVMMMVVGRGGAFDPHFPFTAAADVAHQFTSSSLIRNSSPPVTCS
jgi:hypothetical protein